MAEIEATNEANACDADEVTYPPIFSGYGRLVVKELIDIKVTDKKNPLKVKELIPHTYSRVKWNQLTEKQRGNVLKAWNSLTENQQEEIETKVCASTDAGTFILILFFVFDVYS